MTSQATLAEKIERLPPELRDRLGAFVDELMTLVPEKEPSRKRPRLGWAGGLSESRDNCSSVELQHRALEWAAVTFLFDMNVLLELLFDREQAGDVRRMFGTLEPDAYAISDFSLHSIGVILARMNRHDLLLEFIDDMIIETGMRVVGIPSPHLAEVVAAILRYRLDFDDAYQLAAAERYSLRLVSFDRHFDATPIGRVEPAGVLDRAG